CRKIWIASSSCWINVRESGLRGN
ncbi:uncharacterized protein METZ01_LOCUS494991, partial [marine metagenome]